MDLTTRCPRCGTTFQASLYDLQLRKGYIRCIQCSHIFDGYAEVVSDSPAADAGGRVMPAAPSTPAGSAASSIPTPDTDTGEPEFSVPPQVFRSGRTPVSTPGAVRDDPQDVWVDPLAGATVPPEPFMVEARPGHRSQGGTAAPLLLPDEPPWWAGIVRLAARLLLALLVLLAGAQLVYVYRGHLAQVAPVLRPWLEQACVPLRCQIPYARDISRIVITGSALKEQDQMTQGAGASPGAGVAGQHFILQTTLRNQADAPQEWPTLVLDLKDGAGTLLVRRNLSPAEYLGPAVSAHPFAAHSEVLVRVPVSLDGLRINGYQLDLFYP